MCPTGFDPEDASGMLRGLLVQQFALGSVHITPSHTNVLKLARGSWWGPLRSGCMRDEATDVALCQDGDLWVSIYDAETCSC